MNVSITTLFALSAIALTSCDPVSVTSLHYQPKNTPVAKLRQPLDTATRRFSLEPGSSSFPQGQLLYADARQGPGAKMLVTLDPQERKISILEMFVFSRTPRNKAFESTLRQEMASIGVSLTEAR